MPYDSIKFELVALQKALIKKNIIKKIDIDKER